jgi:hypothetical protein
MFTQKVGKAMLDGSEPKVVEEEGVKEVNSEQ